MQFLVSISHYFQRFFRQGKILSLSINVGMLRDVYMNESFTRAFISGLLFTLLLSVVCLASNWIVTMSSAIVVPDDYSTIQEAINNAVEGDTIFVKTGIYYEHVVVNKTVSLVGEDVNTTIIDGSGIGHVVVITGDGVGMTGFTVQNSGTAYHITGINLNNVNYCNISGNIMMNNEHGLELHNFSYYNTISRNIIIENNKWGLHVIDSHYNNVSENIVGGSLWGSIGIHGFSTHNRISENDIGNNSNFGIIIDGSEYNSVHGNNIANNLWGISVQYSASYNTISRNKIANNDYGIKLESNTYANTFYHNNLVNNTFQTSFVGYNYANSWDDGYPSGGNYWSDYTGVDEKNGVNQDHPGGDGISDTPYIIDANNQDRYPLMKPYGASHDIGITGVTPSKTVIGEGYSTNITIRVMNYGINIETFNLTAYANETIIAAFTNITLMSRDLVTITSGWNTTGFVRGNYTIWANVTFVPSETDTSDNLFINGAVQIGVPCDVTGFTPQVPDGVCNMRDIGYFCSKFGTTPSSLDWDSNCDVTGPTRHVPDGTVNMRDIGEACSNFVQT